MEKELSNKKMRSKLAIFGFILSLVPILMIILYFVIRDLLFNSPIFVILWYNLIIQIIPLVSLILSIIAIVLIKKKKIKGMGFAISGLVISIIEAFLFLAVISRVAS